MKPEPTTLAQLGQVVPPPSSPEEAILERVPNPHQDTDYLIRFAVPEFTSICPVTKQPDFAHIVIDYVPDGWLVESKSLKLFMASFRNHGAFHEDCTIYIGKRLGTELQPRWLRIGGYWYPRGGIPIDVFWQTGSLPTGVWLPDQGRSALPWARLKYPHWPSWFPAWSISDSRHRGLFDAFRGIIAARHVSKLEPDAEKSKPVFGRHHGRSRWIMPPVLRAPSRPETCFMPRQETTAIFGLRGIKSVSPCLR